MKTRILRLFGFLVCLGSLLFIAAVSAANFSSPSPVRVFILHSYEAGNVCGQPQHDGVLNALEKAGFVENGNLQIRAYYMDTKRKNNTPELIEKQACLALQEIRSFEPHVLVTLDDNAFSSVALELVDSPIPIVFCGMNAQPEAYHRRKAFMNSRTHPGHNITGVYEKLHIRDALTVHSRLFPSLEKVLILVDSSPTGRGISEQIALEMAEGDVPCTWEMRTPRTWEEYQREILSANSAPEVGAIYPAALLLKDEKGMTYTAPEIFAWTVENSRKPEIAINYAFTRMGLFGGAAVDFNAMGEQAGAIAVRVLQGESPGDIPVENAQRYALVFNLGRAEQLGITIPSDVLMAADDVILGRE
ncbi:MAG: hypothetical protein JW821_18605 [Deltaproteobacteria bacterium]|nr:hypothetical protein [Deltaproteobacteria bacterium]